MEISNNDIENSIQPDVSSVKVNEQTKNRESQKNYSKAMKTIKVAGLVGIMLPFLAFNAIAMARNIEGVSAFIDAASDAEFLGEFDPSMGAEANSKNGRALIVVHEDYGMDVSPWKWQDNKDYETYRQELEATKNNYLENGDIVVLIYDEKSWYDTQHTPQKNVLHFSTHSNNGEGSSSVVVDGKLYSQSYETLFATLKEAGIDTVEMAGEFRGLCVSQVADNFQRAGFITGWCAECAFPSVDQMTRPEYFPTLEPISNNH